MTGKDRSETPPYDPYVETALADRRAASPSDAGFSLLVSSALGVEVVPLGEKDSFVIGRVPECDITIADTSVSRQHAVLRLGEVVTIEDLASKNGTTVQARPLGAGERAPIAVGTIVEVGSVTVVLQRALTLAAMPRTPATTGTTSSKPSPAVVKPGEPVVVDPTMKRIYAMLDVVAPTTLSVLVLGETGVGKEVFVEALHRRSLRHDQPLIQINCASLPESMLEGELFGYEKGAFTGAVQAKAGLFEAASGGTVFLDEIGEVPLTMQAKLLRVLESGQTMRLGSVKPLSVDVRVVSATNRDLRKLMATGEFRSDLYYRLDGIAITLPPLRRRKASIVPLATMFAVKASQRLGRKPPPISPASVEALEGHAWPGNVRELRNTIERAVVLSAGSPIEPDHLRLVEGSFGDDAAPAPDGAKFWDDVQGFERQKIVDALARSNQNQSEAAKALGMSRRTLVSKLDTYGIERPRKRS